MTLRPAVFLSTLLLSAIILFIALAPQQQADAYSRYAYAYCYKSQSCHTLYVNWVLGSGAVVPSKYRGKTTRVCVGKGCVRTRYVSFYQSEGDANWGARKISKGRYRCGGKVRTSVTGSSARYVKINCR